jgi:hypothetical protein
LTIRIDLWDPAPVPKQLQTAFGLFFSAVDAAFILFFNTFILRISAGIAK